MRNLLPRAAVMRAVKGDVAVPRLCVDMVLVLYRIVVAQLARSKAQGPSLLLHPKTRKPGAPWDPGRRTKCEEPRSPIRRREKRVRRLGARDDGAKGNWRQNQSPPSDRPEGSGVCTSRLYNSIDWLASIFKFDRLDFLKGFRMSGDLVSVVELLSFSRAFKSHG